MFLSERDGKRATKNETALFSLFYRGSYGGLLESPHNWLVPHPLYIFQTSRGPFFIAQVKLELPSSDGPRIFTLGVHVGDVGGGGGVFMMDPG